MKSAISKIIILTVIVYTGIFFLNCGDQQLKTIARVGGRKITVNDYETAFAEGKKTRQIQKAKLEEKKKFLDRMIDKKLKIIDAYQHHIDEDEKIQSTISDRTKKMLFSRLVAREVVEKIIPESMVKEYYKKTSKEVKIRQIFLKFDKSASNKEKVLKKAKKIVREIKAGESFADVAKKKSDDVKTAKNGGLKGVLKWGPKASNNPVYEAAFSMKNNEISEPIATETGYYIIKVINIKQYPTPPFEVEQAKIKQNIYRLFSKDIEKAYYEYIDRLRKKYKLKINEKALELFVERFNFVEEKKPTSSEDSTYQRKERPSPFNNFKQSEKKQSLIECSFSDVTINDFLEELKKSSPRRRPRLKEKEQVRSFIDQGIVPKFLLEKEVEVKNIKNDDEVKRRTRAYRESLMEKNIYQIQVADRVTITEEDIKNYFEEHRDDYKHPPMKEVQEISVKDKTIAESIVKKARAGRNFTSLFNRYNEKKSLDKNKGKLGFISKGRAGIGKHVFKVKAGEITDPIKIGNSYSIVKVLSEKPATLKTYEESKKTASARLRRSLLIEREKEWLNELHNRIDVAVFEKNLEQACKKYIGSDVIFVD